MACTIHTWDRRRGVHVTSWHAFNKQKRQFDYIKSTQWYSLLTALTAAMIRFISFFHQSNCAQFFYLARFSVYFFSCISWSFYIHIHHTALANVHFSLLHFHFHFHSRNELRRKRCMKWACFHFACGICSTRDEMHVCWQNECNSCCILFIFLLQRSQYSDNERKHHREYGRYSMDARVFAWHACVCVAYDSRWSCGEILRSYGRRR